MKIENIHDTWGIIITLNSPEEFFEYSPDYWRELAYNKKLIFFKKVNFTKAQYAEFGLRFGAPWVAESYEYSREGAEIVPDAVGNNIISPISNSSKRLGMTDMPWHADIPNRQYKPFPFRSLWIVDNPLPEVSGKTSWLNLEDAINYLPQSMKDMLPRISVIQQSWYEPGTDIQEFSFVKTHPITGKDSLRLNYFNWLSRKEGWITGVKVDGKLQPDCAIIRNWLYFLQSIPELVYQHTWDTNDIAIYDNWPFVHSRTQLQFDTETQTRKFYRINIDHLDEQEWQEHKNKFFT